jgi:hypothetical protein
MNKYLLQIRLLTSKTINSLNYSPVKLLTNKIIN